jgi:hypothetical protein
MSARILRGHTVSLVNAMNCAIRSMERVRAVVAATTDVPDATGALRSKRDIPMYSAVAEFAVELPSTDPVRNPMHADWRTTNE